MNRLIVVVALAAVFFLPTHQAANATVVFGNLGPSGTGNLSATNTDTTTTRLALAFSTPATGDLDLQSITVGLFFDNSNTQSFTLSIFADNGGNPSSTAFAVSSPTTIGNTAKYTFSYSGAALQPSSTYWIVPSTNLSWYANADFTSPTAQNTSGYGYVNTLQSLNGGATWSNSGLTSYSVSVTAVPEPSSIALVSVALGAFGVTAGRRLRRRRVDASAGAITA